jgi:hypothetical protein
MFGRRSGSLVQAHRCPCHQSPTWDSDRKQFNLVKRRRLNSDSAVDAYAPFAHGSWPECCPCSPVNWLSWNIYRESSRYSPGPYCCLTHVFPPAQLAPAQHALQRRLLGGADAELVGALDLDPGACVGAVEARQRRLPRVRALVTLALVDIVGDRPQLGTRDVVGKGLALRRRPRLGAGLNVSRVSASLIEHARCTLGKEEKLTIQAFLRGTMWSMSTSEGAVHEPPS